MDNIHPFYEVLKNHCTVQDLLVAFEATAFSSWLTGDGYRYYIHNLDGKGFTASELFCRLKGRYLTLQRENMSVK